MNLIHKSILKNPGGVNRNRVGKLQYFVVARKYSVLKEEIFVGIQKRQILGFNGIQLLRRQVGQEIEFVTIMIFDSLDSIREFAEFAGENYEIAVVPDKARAVLFQ